MVRATLHLTVKPGRGDDFVAAWKPISEAVRQVPGNLRQTLCRDPDAPDTVVITSDWQSREAFGAFERSQEQDDLTAPLRELRDSARMTVHDIVTHVEGGTVQWPPA